MRMCTKFIYNKEYVNTLQIENTFKNVYDAIVLTWERFESGTAQAKKYLYLYFKVSLMSVFDVGSDDNSSNYPTKEISSCKRTTDSRLERDLQDKKWSQAVIFIKF